MTTIENIEQMSAVALAMEIDSMAAVLCAIIKRDPTIITLSEGRQVYTSIREAEGWLLSCRDLLVPPGALT